MLMSFLYKSCFKVCKIYYMSFVVLILINVIFKPCMKSNSNLDVLSSVDTFSRDKIYYILAL